MERYLLSSTELLDGLFDSVKQSGLFVLNTQLKIIKANSAFGKVFGPKEILQEGGRLQDIPHLLWQGTKVKGAVPNALVNGVKINGQFIAGDGNKEFVRYQLVSKLIHSDDMSERKLLLIVKEA